MAKQRKNSSSSSSSFPNLLLSSLNFILFLLSSASLTPIIFLKMPPTSLGYAFLMISSISLFSSFIGFYSQLARFCFVTHLSLLLASSMGQLLGILALFTKESSSLSLLKSKRDPRESKFLVRVECGILMAMFVVQLGVVVMTCAVRSCCWRWGEVEEEEEERQRWRRKSQGMMIGGGGKVGEEFTATTPAAMGGNDGEMSKGIEFSEKMKCKYGQWV